MASRRTIVVHDVHAVPGHIACDTVSRSEVVVPLPCEERLLGVLDIGSPSLNRFDKADAEGLQEVVKVHLAGSDVPAA